jgi:hypothetical protein
MRPRRCCGTQSTTTQVFLIPLYANCSTNTRLTATASPESSTGSLVHASIATISGTAAQSGAQPDRRLAMRAWWCMLRISGALRVRGFSAAYLRVRDEAARDVDARRAPALSKAVSSFLSAENVFWRRRGQQDCLPRSLALFLFLRRAGIRVEHKIGARRVPTVAIHAWVEYDGRGILEGSRDLTAYTQLAAIS